MYTLNLLPTDRRSPPSPTSARRHSKPSPRIRHSRLRWPGTTPSRWNVANPRTVSRTAVLSHAVTISGGSSLPLLDPSGRIIVTGASSGLR